MGSSPSLGVSDMNIWEMWPILITNPPDLWASSETWLESSCIVQWPTHWRWALSSCASAGSKSSAGCCILRLQGTFGPLTSSSGTFWIYSLTEQDLQHILNLSVAILQTMASCQLLLHCLIDFLQILSFHIFLFPVPPPIFTTFTQQIILVLTAHKECCLILHCTSIRSGGWRRDGGKSCD